MKKVIALALSAVLALGCLAGCSGNSEPVAAGSTIKIGVLAPLTGTNAEYGKGFEVGTQMAVDRINAAGGINGDNVGDYADTRCDVLVTSWPYFGRPADIKMSFSPANPKP